MSLILNSSCPQLPVTAPHLWAGFTNSGFNNPPPEWKCASDRYYESDPVRNYTGVVTCDCECGVADPDCGYEVKNCQEQTWEPIYTVLECDGELAPVESIFCRMESASCMPLPPGLHFDRNRVSTWTCVPDVYFELSDPNTSLKDCDCSCHDLDPDCQLLYDNIYCPNVLDVNNVPIGHTYEKGPTCVVDFAHGTTGARCKAKDTSVELSCPQLPPFLPKDLVPPGYGQGNPPPEWTCSSAAYYESENSTDSSLKYSCDCGCGAIDPDCGFVLKSCDDQTWNPGYSTFKCNGHVLAKDLMYCRLDSAKCTALPPGIHDKLWTCIPDVYHELGDNGTTLNDCNCACGSLDPDCLGEFNDLYCLLNDRVENVPKNLARCAYMSPQVGAVCVYGSENRVNLTSNCPQLPVTAPHLLAASYGSAIGYDRPPATWTCAHERFYESDPINNGTLVVTCDCGCGAIDPDCGYIPASCDEQTWEPPYTSIECEREVAPVDSVFCRLESATCMPLPPGLRFANKEKSTWTCIPDVYYELLDPGTSLDDCDCSCGDLDPDCQLLYNNIYCPDNVDENGIPIGIAWEDGPTCVVDFADGTIGARCKARVSVELDCPQLPPFLPKDLVPAGYGKGNPPPEWTCSIASYYESEGSTDSGLKYSCDCGCGAIDPDCGFILKSCDDQTWNPGYSTFKCDGYTLDKDLMYCRLDSAKCTALPPGIHEKLWTCIPDVYHELSDNKTKLNDCDCACGSLDPDCLEEFNDLYCLFNHRVVKVPKTDARCAYLSPQVGAACVYGDDSDRLLNGSTCPQLPVTAPHLLAASYGSSIGYGRPPATWTCSLERFYESDPINNGTLVVTCDCGCGAIDPDCGYIPASCTEQTWEPPYTSIECKGEIAPVESVYCRLDSATCMPLPPGLSFDKTKESTWTCIPDVYYELLDPGTSLDDCDCLCGDLDPDCQLLYNNIYCEENIDGNGIPIGIPWEDGPTCVVDFADGTKRAHCRGKGYTELDCPQLPPFKPKDLVKVNASKGNPPEGWTCAPELYYESQGMIVLTDYSCDCGCGVIDPDCGYMLQSCEDQTWNPAYSTFTCAGEPLDKELMYCRLESARCTTLPPGIHDNLWRCIPDVYHELADDLTSLNDCDCNCGSLDPDCLLAYNDLYCDLNGIVEQVGNAAYCSYVSPQKGAECQFRCPPGMSFVDGPGCGTMAFTQEGCCIDDVEPIQECTAFANNTLRVGVLAEGTLDLQATAALWRPTLQDTVNRFMAKFRCRFEVVALHNQALVTAVESNELELVLVDPGLYAILNDTHQAKAIATVKRMLSDGKTYSRQGGLIFRKTSSSANAGLFTLQDLSAASKTRALRVCAVGGSSFAGFTIQWFELFKHGLDMKQLFSVTVYTGSHEESVRRVASGDCDVGFASTGTIEALVKASEFASGDFVILNNPPQYLNVSGFNLDVSTDLYKEWALVTLPRVSHQIWQYLLAPLESSGAFTAPESYDKEDDVIYQLNLMEPSTKRCAPGSQRELSLPLEPCHSCIAGRYNLDGINSCRACEPGTFSPTPGAAKCQECPEGQTTHKFAQVVCQQATEALVYDPIFACAEIEDHTLRVGLLMEESRSLTRWQPTFEGELNTYFNRYQCYFKMVGLTWSEVGKAVDNHEIDLLFSDPGTLAQFSLSHGLTPLCSVMQIFNGILSSRYGGVIFRASSRNQDINTLADLLRASEDQERDLVVCPPSSNSFGGFVAQQYELFKLGRLPSDFSKNVSLVFSGGHDASVAMVSNSSCDIGMVRTETLEKLVIKGMYEIEDFAVINPQVHDHFYHLISTDLYPEWTLSVLPHVKPEIADKVPIPLLALRDWMPAAKAGSHAGFTQAFDLTPVSRVRYDMALEADGSCGPGYSRDLKATPPACSPCPAGFYNSEGLDACNPCGKGFYSPVAGSAECFRCKFGTNSLQLASTTCQPYVNEIILDPTSAIAVWAICLLSAAICLIFCLLVLQYRNTKLMKASSFVFSIVLILACGGLCAATILFAVEPEPSNWVCSLRWWLPCLLSSTVFGSLFSKTYRLFSIFRVYEMKQRVPHAIKFKDVKVAALVGSFVLVTAFVLMIFFLVEPPFYNYQVLQLEGQDFFTTFHACDISKVFVPLVFGLYTALLCGQCWLAWRVRKLPTVFNESQLIAWLLYNTVFVGLICLTVDFMLQDTELTAKMVVRSVALLLGSLTPVFVLYAPKLLIIWRDQYNSSQYSSEKDTGTQANNKSNTVPDLVSKTGAGPDPPLKSISRPAVSGLHRSKVEKSGRSTVSNVSNYSAQNASDIGVSNYEGEIHFVLDEDTDEHVVMDLLAEMGPYLGTDSVLSPPSAAEMGAYLGANSVLSPPRLELEQSEGDKHHQTSHPPRNTPPRSSASRPRPPRNTPPRSASHPRPPRNTPPRSASHPQANTPPRSPSQPQAKTLPRSPSQPHQAKTPPHSASQPQAKTPPRSASQPQANTPPRSASQPRANPAQAQEEGKRFVAWVAKLDKVGQADMKILCQRGLCTKFPSRDMLDKVDESFIKDIVGVSQPPIIKRTLATLSEFTALLDEEEKNKSASSAHPQQQEPKIPRRSNSGQDRSGAIRLDSLDRRRMTRILVTPKGAGVDDDSIFPDVQ